MAVTRPAEAIPEDPLENEEAAAAKVAAGMEEGAVALLTPGNAPTPFVGAVRLAVVAFTRTMTGLLSRDLYWHEPVSYNWRNSR